MLKKTIILLFITGVFFSCSSPTPPTRYAQITSSYIPKYAQFFRIDYYENYKRITVLNPWGNNSLNLEYLISQDSSAKLVHQSTYSFDLKGSAKTVAALSSPVVGILNMLKLRSTIKGITDPDLIYDSIIGAELNSGKIENIGKSIQLNMEKLIMLHPDIIIGSGWDQMSADYKKMIKLKMIPVLMYDWQEVHPLGKAEWMVFLSAFFNKEENAQKMFQEIEKQYLSIKNSVKNINKPQVFNGSEYQGIWYSAGGKSYISKLYRDAGAQYIMENDSSQGSTQLDFEVLMQKAAQTPIWMYTGSIDPIALALLQTPKYQVFDAVKNHRIYSYHKRINSHGANDYWETGGLRPDLVLKDLVEIFHQTDETELDLYYFDEVVY